MRQIKFRAKAKNDTLYYKKGDWIYGHYTYFDDGRHMIYVQELNTWFGIDETTRGQYTGIRDKNGVEIYEGDIVKQLGNYIVKFGIHDNKQWYEDNVSGIGFYLYSTYDYGDEEEEYKLRKFRICSDGYEVVGNIHDKEKANE